MNFFQTIFVLIGLGIATAIVLLLVVPRWILLFQILYYYRKKQYDKCMTATLKALDYEVFEKSTIVKISYVLSCSLALNNKDVFEEYLSKITSMKPRAQSIKISWEILNLLDQGYIEEAIVKYQLLCEIKDKYAYDFRKKVHIIFDYYENKVAMNQTDLIQKRDQDNHPIVQRVHQRILDKLS